MRSSTETYHEVAERCSAYEKTCHCNSMTNKADGEKSCLNCSHFSKDKHCKLDLYDPIVKNLKLQENRTEVFTPDRSAGKDLENEPFPAFSGTYVLFIIDTYSTN